MFGVRYNSPTPRNLGGEDALGLVVSMCTKCLRTVRSMAKKKELSVQVRDAYDTSYRASIDDTSDEVLDARKTLRRLKPKLKKKLGDITAICQAATVVNHAIKTRACTIQAVVQADYVRLLKELDRVSKKKRRSATTSTSSPKASDLPKSLTTKQPMSYAKAAQVLKKHKIISSTNDVMKRGNATSGFLLGRL